MVRIVRFSIAHLVDKEGNREKDEETNHKAA
jgi:hypothetical protein